MSFDQVPANGQSQTEPDSFVVKRVRHLLGNFGSHPESCIGNADSSQLAAKVNRMDSWRRSGS